MLGERGREDVVFYRPLFSEQLTDGVRCFVLLFCFGDLTTHLTWMFTIECFFDAFDPSIIRCVTHNHPRPSDGLQDTIRTA